MNMKTFRFFCRPTFGLLLLFSSTGNMFERSVVLAADRPSLNWQKEWEKTIKAAEQEGRLNVYSNGGIENTVGDFEKKFRKIRVVLVTGRSGRLVTRLMAERRGAKYLADIAKLGTGSASAFYRARPFPLQTIASSFVLPEVVDSSPWWQNRHHYVDPEGKYILATCASLHVDLVSFNTTHVSPFEITSYWELLKPKWKGKIASMDPRAAGGREGGRLIYYHPELGPKFFKRLLTEMDLTLSQDPRQAVDWLAQGRFAFLLLTSPREVLMGKDKGLPVDILDPRPLKEAPVVDNASSNMVLLDRAPHPNAAKVFMNWFLSQEGQVSYQGSHGACDSTRDDISKNNVPAIYRRQEGLRYFRSWDSSWMDIDAVQKFVNESLKESQ